MTDEQLTSDSRSACCGAAILDACLHNCKYHCSKCLKPYTARKSTSEHEASCDTREAKYEAGICNCKLSKLPPPQSPMEWEEAFEQVWATPQVGDAHPILKQREAVKAFITRTVKEAEERGHDVGRKWYDYGAKEAIENARAERTKEIVEEVKTFINREPDSSPHRAAENGMVLRIIARLTEQEA